MGEAAIPGSCPRFAISPDGSSRSSSEDFDRLHGVELPGLGVTLNLAPVIDLKLSWSRNRLDFHSLIHQRGISADPAVCAPCRPRASRAPSSTSRGWDASARTPITSGPA
jgi:hypothetical protein